MAGGRRPLTKRKVPRPASHRLAAHQRGKAITQAASPRIKSETSPRIGVDTIHQNHSYDKLKFVGQSISFPANRLRLETDTRGAQLFIHDQKSAQPMKVVHVSLASEVIGEITDIRAFANVDQIRQAVGTH